MSELIKPSLSASERGVLASTELLPYSQSEVKSHLHDGSRSTSFAEVTGPNVEIDCVDDRSTKKIVGAPAGDIGIIAQEVRAIEIVLGNELTFDETRQVYERYGEVFGISSMHTGTHGVKIYRQMLSEELPWARQMFNEGAESAYLIAQNLLLNPRVVQRQLRFNDQQLLELQTVTLDLTGRPEFHDCGDFKHQMSDPKAYDNRLELMQNLARIHFDASWQGRAGVTVVVHGDHAARAAASIQMNAEALERFQTGIRAIANGSGSVYDLRRSVPLVAPNISNGTTRQMFVDHPHVADGIRTLATHLVVGSLDFVPKDKLMAIEAEAQRLAKLRKNQTLVRLARRQPVYQCVEEEPLEFEVKNLGYIKGLDSSGELILVPSLDLCDVLETRRLW